MDNTLGKHLIIDFYNCKTEFDEAEELQPAITRAFELVNVTADDVYFSQSDDELTCIAIAGNTHICIHFYQKLAYAAVDVYSFNLNLKASEIMRALKANFRSDRIKATSVRRGDFGSIRDMRPKRTSSITTARRMKNTGKRIRKTSVKMYKILRHPKRTQRARRISK